MPRALTSRRIPRHHLMIHRRPQRRTGASTRPAATPVRLSDLILGLLGVTLLGGLALVAAASLIGRAVAP